MLLLGVCQYGIEATLLSRCAKESAGTSCLNLAEGAHGYFVIIDIANLSFHSSWSLYFFFQTQLEPVYS